MSLIADDKACMGLEALFEEDRRDNESFDLDVLFGETPDPDVDDDWVTDYGLTKLFHEETEMGGGRRTWTATDVVCVAASGAVVVVPLFIWALRGCRNIQRLVRR